MTSNGRIVYSVKTAPITATRDEIEDYLWSDYNNWEEFRLF